MDGFMYCYYLVGLKYDPTVLRARLGYQAFVDSGSGRYGVSTGRSA